MSMTTDDDRRLFEERIRSLVQQGVTPVLMAMTLGVHPNTIYRWLAKLNLTSETRQICVPSDKTVFIISVDPMKAADFEIVLKQVLRDELFLRDHFFMQVYDVGEDALTTYKSAIAKNRKCRTDL